nr:Orphan Rhodopsin-like G protein-coupled receptor [Hymenolepis microstoma]
MSSIKNREDNLECQQHVLEYVRQFGYVYFGFLIIFGTIGNIISLLVIRGVGANYNQRPYSFPREPSEAGSSRNSPDRIIVDNTRPPPSVPSRVSVISPHSVLNRRPIRKHPSKSIFTALAIADTIALWVNPFRYWILFVFGFDIRQNNSVTLCRLQTFLTYATRDVAIWVLCLLTIERYLIGCYPYKAKIIWRGKRKICAWVIIFTVIFVKNSILLFIMQLIYDNDNGKYAIMDPNYKKTNASKPLLCDTLSLTARKVFFFVDIVIYSLVPTILLLVLNIALYRVIQQRNTFSGRYLFSSRKKNAARITKIEEGLYTSMVVKNKGSLKVKRSVIQANRLLIPVGVFHLITSVPICIFSIIEDAMQLKRSPSSYVRCVLDACGYLFVMLGTTSYGINCLIYFLSSRNFRERLYALTKTIRLCKHKSPDLYYHDNADRSINHNVSSASIIKDTNCEN